MILNYRNFNRHLDKNFVFENNPNFAVAVSGGPDSMCLLFLLNEWNKKIKGKFIALIINHNIRSNSSKESTYVFKFLKNKNINSKIINVKKNQVVKKNMSEARLNRYDSLTNFCKKNNIIHLFVGHHMNDNLETFINRKISGSDFEGLSSMKSISLRNKTNIIRPLLNFSKKDILEFNYKQKIPFVYDPSNKNMTYTRPVVRKFIKESNILVQKEIINEFNTVLDNYNLYKSMINNILIDAIIFVNINFIKIRYSYIINLDNLLSEKIIKIIYKYFYQQNPYLRSKKIQLLLKQLKYDKFKIFNLKGLLIKKVNNSVIFCKKSN